MGNTKVFPMSPVLLLLLLHCSSEVNTAGGLVAYCTTALASYPVLPITTSICKAETSTNFLINPSTWLDSWSYTDQLFKDDSKKHTQGQHFDFNCTSAVSSILKNSLLK